MMRAGGVHAAVLCALLASACEPSPRGLVWRLELGDASLGSRISAVEVWIAKESCSGERVHAEIARAGETFVSPPSLEQGLYGFGARAYDTMCAPIAEGCSVVALPIADDATLRVQLTEITGVADCPLDRCVLGVCGFADAGMDAGPPADGGPDASVRPDTGPADSGGGDGVCDPVTQTGCVAGASCYLMRAGTVLYCASPGTGRESEACLESDDCSPGFYCTTISTARMCLQMCRTGDVRITCMGSPCASITGAPEDFGVCPPRG